MWYAEEQQKRLESRAVEGDSPVCEIPKRPSGIPSNTGHVKPRMNLARPRAKAKYSSMTDSAQVL